MLWLRRTAAAAAVAAILWGTAAVPAGAAEFAEESQGVAQSGMHPPVPPPPDLSHQLGVLAKVLEIVRSDYVDKPDDAKLLNAAIDGMVKSLDPHSSYMDARSYSDLQATTNGQFGGLGMEVNMEDGALKVIAPLDDTPAARAGILAGDVIEEVDGASLKGLTLTEAVEKLRGAPGTEVSIRVQRRGKDAAIALTLTREVIKVSAIRHELMGGDVGYVRITQFSARVADDLRQAIESMAAPGRDTNALKGYIIDLRNDPGGLLDQAVRVAGAFLNTGEIVSIRGRNASDQQRFTASPGDVIDGRPLIVLINGGSASASEIVAAALQDQKRATVIGSRTFGKASVQTIIPLGPGNGALRLTTARYYRPSGHLLQAQGVKPDIEVLQDVPKEVADRDPQIRSEADLPGHLKAEGTEESGSQSWVPTDARDDKALAAALALLRGTLKNDAFPPNPAQAVSAAH